MKMNRKESLLLREEIGDAGLELCLRSGARIDTGRWWRRSPLWVCVATGDLIMLAVGRRRYSARVPISECGKSHYNPASGEFIVVPGADLKFSSFPLSPRKALDLLQYIESAKVTTNTHSRN